MDSITNENVATVGYVEPLPLEPTFHSATASFGLPFVPSNHIRMQRWSSSVYFHDPSQTCIQKIVTTSSHLKNQSKYLHSRRNSWHLQIFPEMCGIPSWLGISSFHYSKQSSSTNCQCKCNLLCRPQTTNYNLKHIVALQRSALFGFSFPIFNEKSTNFHIS